VDEPVPDEAFDAVERWFTNRGIPNFIHDYSASEDVFTRAAPILTLVFVAELLGALNLEWPWWGNALAIAGGSAILAGALVISNLVRGRSAWSRPQTVGWPDLTLFVLVPPLLPLVFGGQSASAVATAIFNLGVVGVVYLAAGYGVVSMTRWAIGRLGRQIGDLFRLLVRALPLLLLFVTFLFINAEVWQVSATLTGPFFWATLGLFFVVGTLFIVTRLPREVGELADFESDDDVLAAAVATPAAALGRPVGLQSTPALSRREWANVGLVVLFSQGIQVLVVAALIAAFFVVFGTLAVRPDVTAAWTGATPHVLADLEFWGRAVPITEELLRVSGFLGAFSGLYFTVVAVTDQTYREEFHHEVVAEVREAFAVRAVYRAALSRPPA